MEPRRRVPALLLLGMLLGAVEGTKFKKLRDEVIKALEEAYNCSTCPLGSSYEGSEVVRFSEGSVVAETKSTFKTDSNANAEQVKEQFNNALKDNTINSLRVKDLKVNEILSGSATTTATTTSRAPLVPGWGIALLVLACVILLIVIIILLLIIIYVCRRRSKGQLELLGSRGSYYPMADRSDYPQYTTHTRFTSPNGKQNSYNQMPGNGTNLYSYTNHAVESDNL
ncbi:hypothetical protein scyTo_0019420 [Scyliorhinus torazame]|uniref:Mucin-1 n=1 Tax=Scyliorhinus torazame TaxID=75743 RepID=A0A401PZE7_SCYTO|nr:hypothetical protein [Scyliorhinus torazame]